MAVNTFDERFIAVPDSGGFGGGLPPPSDGFGQKGGLSSGLGLGSSKTLESVAARSTTRSTAGSAPRVNGGRKALAESSNGGGPTPSGVKRGRGRRVGEADGAGVGAIVSAEAKSVRRGVEAKADSVGRPAEVPRGGGSGGGSGGGLPGGRTSSARRGRGSDSGRVGWGNGAWGGGAVAGADDGTTVSGLDAVELAERRVSRGGGGGGLESCV